MRSQFENVYADKVAKILQDKTDVVVDFGKASLKPLSAKRLVSAIDYLNANPNIVFNGFKSSGIAEHQGFEFRQVNDTPTNFSCDSD